MTAFLALFRIFPPKKWAIIAAVLLIVGLGLGWKCSADRAEREALARKTAESQTTAAAGAGELIDKQIQREREGADLTADNRDEILGAENANEDAGATGRALLAALCRRRMHYDDSRCVALRRSDTADAQD